MARVVVVALVWVSGWVGTYDMVVTLLTFQLPIGWLNEESLEKK